MSSVAAYAAQRLGAARPGKQPVAHRVPRAGRRRVALLGVGARERREFIESPVRTRAIGRSRASRQVDLRFICTIEDERVDDAADEPRPSDVP
jgi:uncharacterized cupin superfamily protein